MAALAVHQTQAGKTKTLMLPGDVKITYVSGAYDIPNEKWSFENGVVVDVDLTRIQADHVDIDVKTQMGSASGHVRLDDPIATVRADRIEMWWAKDGQKGYAKNAEIHIGSSHLKADELEMTPKLWTLKNVEVTTSLANPPWYEVHSSFMTVKPGQSGRMKKPKLYILGRKIVTLPDRSFNLDKRSEGLTFPGLNYSRQNGLGASWGGGFLLNHATNVAFSVGAFPDSRPGYGASISKSFLADGVPTTYITPASDFGERFGFGFLDNIAVTSPEGEDRAFRSPRSTVSLGSSWNQTLTDRGSSAPFSKAVEGVYERGGDLFGFGYISQTRIQTIRELTTPLVTRLELIEEIGPPPIRITRNLRTITRVDTQIFLGETDYGWVRGFIGLAYMPVPQVRISAGTFYSADSGTPQFPIDPLYSKAGYTVRGDVNLGPTKFSYLQKYDRYYKWFDREYSVSQVVGCFEPYLLYRKNPTDYQLGLRLRLDNLTDLLTQRNYKRPSNVTKVISPRPDGKP